MFILVSAQFDGQIHIGLVPDAVTKSLFVDAFLDDPRVASFGVWDIRTDEVYMCYSSDSDMWGFRVVDIQL